jgi:hypothetical protein
MLLKIFLKIWPSLIPIVVYLVWVYVIDGFFMKRFFKRKKIIEGEFKTVGEKSTEAKNSKSGEGEEKGIIGKFSLQNQCFVLVLYLSLMLSIITLLVAAFS